MFIDIVRPTSTGICVYIQHSSLPAVRPIGYPGPTIALLLSVMLQSMAHHKQHILSVDVHRPFAMWSYNCMASEAFCIARRTDDTTCGQKLYSVDPSLQSALTSSRVKIVFRLVEMSTSGSASFKYVMLVVRKIFDPRRVSPPSPEVYAYNP